MKLKRFNTDNNHIDYVNYKTTDDINDKINESITTIPEERIESKIEILANISKNWNDELKKEFFNIKSLYKYDVIKLKEIKEKYINIKGVNEKEIKKTPINNKIDESSKDKIVNSISLLDSVAELQMIYGTHDAIKDIRIDENQIYIDLLCNTDIEQSVLEYNGYKIIYNKVCEIPTLEKDDDIGLVESDINYDKLVEQSIFMYKNLFN